MDTIIINKRNIHTLESLADLMYDIKQGNMADRKVYTEAIVEAYVNGNLMNWLRDNNYEAVANELDNITKCSNDDIYNSISNIILPYRRTFWKELWKEICTEIAKGPHI